MLLKVQLLLSWDSKTQEQQMETCQGVELNLEGY